MEQCGNMKVIPEQVGGRVAADLHSSIGSQDTGGRGHREAKVGGIPDGSREKVVKVPQKHAGVIRMGDLKRSDLGLFE